MAKTTPQQKVRTKCGCEFDAQQVTVPCRDSQQKLMFGAVLLVRLREIRLLGSALFDTALGSSHGTYASLNRAALRTQTPLCSAREAHSNKVFRSVHSGILAPSFSRGTPHSYREGERDLVVELVE